METIFDITREMREANFQPPMYQVWVNKYADRIDAAYELSNNAKMREALEEILDCCKDSLGYNIAYVEDQARQALAEPPRNCDVGTVEEQTERFFDFCDGYHCATGYNGCGKCPLWTSDTIGKHCELKWAQMPYKKGETK